MADITLDLTQNIVQVTLNTISISDSFTMGNIDHAVILNRGVTTHEEIDTRLSELTNVDNTSDLDKPISTLTQDALDLKIGNNLEILIASVSSATSQEPSTTDTPLQIEFGPGVGTGSDPVQMDALGNITFNIIDNYFIRVAVHFGRSGSSGISELRLRSLVNGNQIGETIGISIGSSDEVIYDSVNIITRPANVSDVLTFEVMRDSSGNDSGGLFQLPTTPVDWTDAPSARILIQRFT